MSIDRETVIRLAREAGIPVGICAGNPTVADMERFSTLVMGHGRKPLTDTELEEVFLFVRPGPTVRDWMLRFGRAIEVLHGITNKENT